MASRRPINIAHCQINPKCCYETHDLECPNKFNPPLLSTATEFCTEVLAKGIPIPKCTLAKPKKLVIEKEPPPLAKPTTSRHLKNWQRWCYIWRQTYNTLTAKRQSENRPPVMTSGEAYGYKNEDKELFERTLHAYHLNGFYVKNTYAPSSLRPKPTAGSEDMREVMTKRYLRQFPEMKRRRYPNYVRNEMSLAPRKDPPGRPRAPGGSNRSSSNKNQNGFNWEEKWMTSKHIEKMKDILNCDIGLYGKTDPVPDNLIFKPAVMKDGPSERIYDKKSTKKGGGDFHVPQLVFSTENKEDEEIGNTSPDSLSMTALEEKQNNYYMVQRGPILKIRSQSTEVALTFSKSTTELPHFINNPAVLTVPVEQYMLDENHHFSVTPKCKDMKFIILKNEGTTAIRYQWFRNPPSLDAHKMLQNPTEFKSIRLNQPLDREKPQENVYEMDSPEANIINVTKSPHLEFHFSELPGVILPGQCVDFPIIFRSKKSGFFHETMYLLTHPRMHTQDGRYYSVGLSGVCTDVELAESGNEMYEIEKLKNYLRDKVLEEESKDLMDSIVDRSLWGATNNNPLSPLYTSSLPNGRITAEGVFYAHNKDFYYYFGKAEKALELVHQLTEMLVPQGKSPECDFSIQCLYSQVMTAREEQDLFWEKMRTDQTEDLLAELNQCMVTLCEPRVFTWATTERRKYVACYMGMVVTFDEIFLGFDRLHNFYDSEVIKQIDSKQAESLISEYIRKEMEQNIYWIEEDEFNEDEEVDEDEEIIDLESISDKIPPLSDALQPDGLIAIEEPKNENVTEIVDDKGTAPPATNLATESKLNDAMTEPGPEALGEDEEVERPIIVVKKKKQPAAKLHTVLTLEETMIKRVKDDRRRVLKEVRVKLFEDLFCEGLERVLSTVDSFNNMLDYRPSDAVVCIDDLC